MAKQTGFPVISVSQSMRIIALYIDGRRYVLDDSSAILSRANQALATLERYKLRLDEVAGTLSALEIEDLVTVRDAMTVSQRLERVRRIATEIGGYVVELGTDGRLLSLQLEELMAGVEGERQLVVRDYLVVGSGKRQRTVDDALDELDALSDQDLLDLSTVARAFGYPSGADALEVAGQPARLPAARQGAPPARPRRGPAGGALRRAAAAAGGRHRRPAGRGRRRRHPRPQRPRGPVAPGGDVDPRAVRVARHGTTVKASPSTTSSPTRPINR